MASNAVGAGPKVIYALVDAKSAPSAYGVRGLNDAPVYAIAVDGVAAVVSDFVGARVRPERRNLMAHRAVLQHLLESGTVLPMRFGIVANNAEAVRKLLRDNVTPIAEQMARVADRVEMGLRVLWNVANIYEYFVSTHPVLREARDRLLQAGDAVGREERIEIGRLFDQLVSEERKKHTEFVTEILQGYCDEILVNPVKKENEVMNLACLVGREAIEEFEKGVFEASKHFGNEYLLDYSGPWAPHNFVSLDLRLTDA